MDSIGSHDAVHMDVAPRGIGFGARGWLGSVGAGGEAAGSRGCACRRDAHVSAAGQGPNYVWDRLHI